MQVIWKHSVINESLKSDWRMVKFQEIYDIREKWNKLKEYMNVKILEFLGFPHDLCMCVGFLKIMGIYLRQGQPTVRNDWVLTKPILCSK